MEARVDAARGRALLQHGELLQATQVGPLADLDPEHAAASLRAERARAGRDAEPVEGRLDPVAHFRRRRALDARRVALAMLAVQERLWECADDCGYVWRRGPVPVVPLHDVAGREGAVGGAGRSLDAVDEVEPVVAARSGEPIDRLDEAAAVARARLRMRLQETHHGVARSHVRERAGCNRLPAEVARHAQLHARPALGGTRPEAAAGQPGAERNAERPPHRTPAVTGNERMRPGCSANSV